jgi:hypothetical protein
MIERQNKTRGIPTSAWVIAITTSLIVSVPVFVFAIPSDPKMSHWPIAAKICFSFGLLLTIGAYVLLVGYIYGDAKRRGMRYVMWTLLAIFIPNAIGIILYFILRDPLPTPCPGCGASVKRSFIFCPHCATALRPTCPHCGHAVERSWSHCPNCGAATATGKDVVASAAPSTQQPL